jgi:hypothetical protein
MAMANLRPERPTKPYLLKTRESGTLLYCYLYRFQYYRQYSRAADQPTNQLRRGRRAETLVSDERPNALPSLTDTLAYALLTARRA